MYVYTKKDYLILRTLYKNKAFSQFMSLSRKELEEKTKLSYNKIIQTLKKFMEDGFIKEGVPQSRSKTYYITSLGENHLKELLKRDGDTE